MNKKGDDESANSIYHVEIADCIVQLIIIRFEKFIA